jgi:predicted dehydrogenase
VGVIGLGRRWQRYQPALQALHGQLEVRAVCDQVHALAEQTARQLGCVAAAGPLDLVEREDVEAVLLFDRQWYGLWPVFQASRLGKPVFCPSVLLAREEALPALRERVRSTGLPVLPGNPLVLHPHLGRLRGLLEEQLGRPRLLRCEQIVPGRARLLRQDWTPALLDRLLPWLHLCAALLEGEPRSFAVTAPPRSGLLNVTVEFPKRQAAQLALFLQPGARPTARLEVLAAHGRAGIIWPRQLRWYDDEGMHVLRQPPIGTPRLLLDAFVQMLDGGDGNGALFEQACRALGWLHALRERLPARVK